MTGYGTEPNRLVLRFNPDETPGQFTFRQFEANTTDSELHDIAMHLNAFQECNVHRVFKVQTGRF